MRVERSGRTDHELIERPDVTACATCGQPFRPPHYTRSWFNCPCAAPTATGHRVYVCMRPGCRGEVLDPPHTATYGPTANYS